MCSGGQLRWLLGNRRFSAAWPRRFYYSGNRSLNLPKRRVIFRLSVSVYSDVWNNWEWIFRELCRLYILKQNVPSIPHLVTEGSHASLRHWRDQPMNDQTSLILFHRSRWTPSLAEALPRMTSANRKWDGVVNCAFPIVHFSGFGGNF